MLRDRRLSSNELRVGWTSRWSLFAFIARRTSSSLAPSPVGVGVVVVVVTASPPDLTRASVHMTR